MKNLSKVLCVLLLDVGLLYGQTEAINVVGGGGSGMYGAGNIDGVGRSAAIQNPLGVAKSIDNQLIIGDDYGLKKVNIKTKSITTLHSFDTKVRIYDIEVDSKGNIYAGIGVWIDDPKSCNDSQYTFWDSRVYKFSQTGDILEVWGDACRGSELDFYEYTVSLAIDSRDNVYAISSWTPEKNNQYGTKSTIKKLESGGVISSYADVYYDGKKIDSIRELEYYDGAFYLSGVIDTYRYTPGSSSADRILTSNSNAPSGIEFDSDGTMFLAQLGNIKQSFTHNSSIYTPYILGISTLTKTKYRPFDDVVYSGVDALNLQVSYIPRVVKIGDELYFSARDENRIVKVTSPSNEPPTLSLLDYPTEMSKGVNYTFKFKASDEDGFPALLSCDFGDGSGETTLFKGVSNGYGSDDIRRGVRYA